MDSLRYPIGEFEPVKSLSPQQRTVWMNEIAEIPMKLRLTVQDLTPSQLDTPIDASLVLIESLRHRFAALLRTLYPEDFKQRVPCPR
jgi:hypothetical protein